MNRFVAIAALVAAAPWAFAQQRAGDDPGQKSCDERYSFYQENLFRIESEDNTGGVAMFVGRNGRQFWLAAPAHVVYSAGDGGKLTNDVKQNLTVSDLDQRQVPLCPGKTPTNPVSTLDLTFICVLPGINMFVHDEVMADETDAQASFVLFGAGGALRNQRRDVRIGKLDEKDPRSGATYRLSGANIVPGDSGSIVANCRGVIGIALNSQQQLLSVETVHAEAKQTAVPWTISEAEYFATGETSDVCPDFGDGAARALVLKSLPSGNVVELDGCASVPHAKYEVLARDPHITCTPQYLTVSSRSPKYLNPKAQCFLRLSGTWQSSDAGELTCVESAPRLAQCSGWLGLKSGLFSGTANAVSDTEIVFRGMFAGPFNSDLATGEFIWSNDVLTGTLRFGVVQREFSLRRVL